MFFQSKALIGESKVLIGESKALIGESKALIGETTVMNELTQAGADKTQTWVRFNK